MPLTRIKQKYQVTIPEKLRREARLEVGDFLDIYMEQNNIVLTPKILVDKNIEENIKEGLSDLKTRRVTPAFSSVKEFKRYIKKRR